MRKTSRFNSLAERIALFGGSAVLVILGFVLAYQFVEPAPPRTIRIATGGAEYAYYQFGLQYQQLLKQEGINLQVVETAGSVENLALLKAGKVDIAFMQSGIGREDTALHGEETAKFRSLGSLYFEPLWLFTHSNIEINNLTDLKGKRIIVGAEGSGTYPVALTLLKENGVSASNATLLKLAGQSALDALDNNQADALFMVTSPSSQSVQQLFLSDQYQLFNFEQRAKGYQRLHSFLSGVQLPRGVVSMEHNLPARDITLLAPAATLVVTEDFHSALAALFLQMATDIHSQSTFFSDPGQFPSQHYTDFTLHEDAQRFFKSGPPFLQRFLPFWAANLIDRLFVMILPVLTLMIPLAKLLPPTYRWRIRSRIYRWYDELRELDFKAGTAEGAEQARALLEDLNKIEKEVMQVEIPRSYAENQYNLRLHIRLIREVLDRKIHGL